MGLPYIALNQVRVDDEFVVFREMGHRNTWLSPDQSRDLGWRLLQAADQAEHGVVPQHEVQ